MLIWRLEDRNNQGVFTGGHVYAMPDKLRNRHDPYSHPGPYSDGLGDIERREVCGFRSLKQYRQWFKRKAQRDFLTRRGLTLKLYRIPTRYVRIGGMQVVFVINAGTHIASRKPNRG